MFEASTYEVHASASFSRLLYLLSYCNSECTKACYASETEYESAGRSAPNYGIPVCAIWTPPSRWLSHI